MFEYITKKWNELFTVTGCDSQKSKSVQPVKQVKQARPPMNDASSDSGWSDDDDDDSTLNSIDETFSDETDEEDI